MIENRPRSPLESFLHERGANHLCKQEDRIIRLEMTTGSLDEKQEASNNSIEAMNTEMKAGFNQLNNRILVGLGFVISILLTALGFLIWDLLKT